MLDSMLIFLGMIMLSLTVSCSVNAGCKEIAKAIREAKGIN